MLYSFNQYSFTGESLQECTFINVFLTNNVFIFSLFFTRCSVLNLELSVKQNQKVYKVLFSVL